MNTHYENSPSMFATNKLDRCQVIGIFQMTFDLLNAQSSLGFWSMKTLLLGFDYILKHRNGQNQDKEHEM